MLVRPLVLTIVVVSLSVTGVFLATWTGARHSAITVDDPVHDFGEVFIDCGSHKPLLHEFVLTNTGREALTIRSVRSSCGCTAVDFSSEPIQPGESRTLRTKFEVNETGERESQLTIDFENGERLVLSLFARITHDRRLATVQPAVVIADRATPGKLMLLATGASSRHVHPPAVAGLEVSRGFEAQFIEWKPVDIHNEAAAASLNRWRGEIEVRATDVDPTSTKVGRLQITTEWGEIEIPVIYRRAHSIE